MHDENHQPLMREVDLSLAVQIPNDRKLTQMEQITLFRDVVPQILRTGDHPDERERGYDEFWEKYRRTSTAIMERYGWLLNRLDWDKEWIGEGYVVPDCCQPGAKRLSRKRLASLRRAEQSVPPIKLSEASSFGAAPF